MGIGSYDYEAAKSHYLLSARWRIRRVGGVFWEVMMVWVQRSNNQECWCYAIGQGKIDVLAHTERIQPFSTFLFYLDPQYVEWDPPHCWGQSPWLSQMIQTLISSWNTLTGTPEGNVLQPFWTSLNTVKLIHKINPPSW